jgi:outer membrane immunogenic protein
MTKLHVGSAAIAALLVATPAVAADMLLKAPVPPVFSWTGWYIGANGGGVWGDTDPGLSIDQGPNGGSYFTFGAGEAANAQAVQAANGSFRNSGWTAGGQIGYNYQSGLFLFGVESDFEAFKPTGSFAAVGALPPTAGGCGINGSCTPFTVNSSSSANWLSTYRGRLGVTHDRWLVYVTAGVAVAEMSFSSVFTNATTVPPQVSGGLVSNFSSTRTRVGAALGFGTEWAFLQNWSLGVEYLFIGLNGFNNEGVRTVAQPTLGAIPPPGTCPPSGAGGFCSVFRYAFTMNDSVVRAKLNYHLGNSLIP